MRLGWVVIFVWAAAGSTAHAAFTVSHKATMNVSCSAKICHSTAQFANLNSSEMADRLAAGNLELIAEEAARDIRISKGVSYASGTTLTLTAWRSIAIEAPLTVMGPGSVVLDTGETETGGELTFSGKGRLSFQDPGSALTIDSHIYTLALDLAALAGNIAADPHGFHALANDYDAAGDGVYASAPVGAQLTGTFNGLGNTIERLKIKSTEAGQKVGLFADAGVIRNIHLERVSMSGPSDSAAGGIAANCHASVSDSSVSGRISGGANTIIGGICGTLTGGFIADSHASTAIVGHGIGGFAGGLVGHNVDGHISVCYATGMVQTDRKWIAGGLIGHHQGQMEDSFASGAVTVGDGSFAGGLIGEYVGGVVFFDYANGPVAGGVNSTVGGLIGRSNGDVQVSYSSGAVTSGSRNSIGGFVGVDQAVLSMEDDYWDIDTSGRSDAAGNDPNDIGVTGLTTEEFQAGLPDGFPAAIWAEDPAINNGLPYLLRNPPH
jgi:hypothetical protein